MQIMDMLDQAGGVGSIAQQLGIPESQASAGVAALLPAILAVLLIANAAGAAPVRPLTDFDVRKVEGLADQLALCDLTARSARSHASQRSGKLPA